MNLPKLLHQILDEPGTNELSWGRVASSVALVSALVWVSHLILKGTSPDYVGLSTFVCAPYASNKAATALSQFSNNPLQNQQQGAPPPPAPVPPAPGN